MLKKSLASFLLGFVLMSITIGCSSHSPNPTTPAPESEKNPVPVVEINPTELGHELLGVWNMTFDPEKMTTTIEPNRELGWHFNVKSFIPTPGVIINSFDPGTWTIDCNVTLRNPYVISGYDVRLIIFTTDTGRTIINADNWTSLYDIAGGDTKNPFKAYAKSEPNRIFAGPISHVENLVINLAGNFNVQFAVDASYPSNCEEPYQISDLVLDNPLYDRLGDNTRVHLNAYRWNTEKWMNVVIDCPDILEEPLELDTSDYEYFYGYVYNWMDAPAGLYPAIITAYTDNPISLYSFDSILVTQKPIYGWVRGFPTDDGIAGVETDENGNIFFALNPSERLVSYTKDATEIWQRNLKSLGPIEQINDLSYHPNCDFIYSTGSFYSCGTVDFSAMSFLKCFNGSPTPCDVISRCFKYSVTPNQVEVDSSCNAYSSGLYNNGQGGSAIMWKVNSGLASQWINDWENPGGGMLFADLEISDEDTIYGAGKFWGSYIDMDPSTEILKLNPLGLQDAFWSEWDADGSWIRSLRWGGFEDDDAIVDANAICYNDMGHVIVAGTFKGTVDFDPHSMSEDIHTSTGYQGNLYISKFLGGGLLVDGFQLSGEGTATPLSIAVDQNENIYVCGSFRYGTVDFNPGANTENRTPVGNDDMFVAKYNYLLSLVWVQTWGTSSDERAIDIVYDRINNYIYFVGEYGTKMDFDPGEGICEMTPADSSDPFLMRLLPNGTWEY